ncbi:MAG: peptide-methionine (R)-S-oxide reductase [Oxalobacteraceae bacterium]|nr:peptide-methionine (R)-S-oxide reductase [Oxalobacteraceae bacterium]
METKKVIRSDAEWRAQLEPMSYEVTRHAATERAFTGKYWDHHEHGIYHCVCCDTPLFTSDTKFDSGCGWPSYFEAIDPANVTEKVDRSHGMIRTEILCKVCDAHLGHVFPDGCCSTYSRLFCFLQCSNLPALSPRQRRRSHRITLPF